MYNKGYYATKSQTLSLRKPFIPVRLRERGGAFTSHGITFSVFHEVYMNDDGEFESFMVLTEYN